MTNKPLDSKKYPLIRVYNVDRLLWNTKTKSFSWNVFSTKKNSLECLTSPKSVNYNLDVKKMTRKGVTNYLNTLFEMSKEVRSIYLGPRGINEWIYENMVLDKIISYNLRNFLETYLYTYTPFGYYLRVQVITEFIEYCSMKVKVETNELNDNYLNQISLFEMFVNKGNLSNKKKEMLGAIFKIFFPNIRLSELITKPAKTIKIDYMEHPYLYLYKKYLLKKGIKEVTITAYIKTCLSFMLWLKKTYKEFNDQEIKNLPLFLVEDSHLSEFKIHLKNKVIAGRISESNSSTIFYIVRSLFFSLYNLNLIKKDIATEVSSIPYEKYKYREIPTDEEISCFFKTIDIYAPNPKLFKLAYGLMLNLGLRCRETITLRWSDINFENQTISIQGKCNNVVMPLPQGLQNILLLLKPKTTEKYIFQKNFLNTLIEYHQLFCMISKWSYPGRFHLFRHTFITKLSERSDCPPQLLQALARHEYPENTSLYIHRNEDTLRKRINKLEFF